MAVNVIRVVRGELEWEDEELAAGWESLPGALAPSRPPQKMWPNPEARNQPPSPSRNTPQAISTPR